MKKLLFLFLLSFSAAAQVVNAPKIPYVNIERLRTDAVSFTVRFQQNAVNLNMSGLTFRCDVSERGIAYVRVSLTEGSGITKTDSTITMTLTSQQVQLLTKDAYQYRLYTVASSVQTTRLAGNFSLWQSVPSSVSGYSSVVPSITINYTSSGATAVSNFIGTSVSAGSGVIVTGNSGNYAISLDPNQPINPSKITQSSAYRFATDSEKALWNTNAYSQVLLGSWNASTNTPTLSSSSGWPAQGRYYIVSVAGTQSVTGSSTAFAVGDWVASTGTAWVRVPFAIADASLTGAKLQDAAITGAKIADAAINGAKIADGSVSESKLEANLKADYNTLITGVGIPVLNSYPINFTPLNSTGGANNSYINNVPVIKRGRLSSVRVKTVVGSTVTVYVYDVATTPSLSFTLRKTYATFVTTSATHTQAIVDTFTVQAGQYIGIKSTGNLSFGSGGFAWYVEGSTYNTITLSYDFTLNTQISTGMTVTDRVTLLETADASKGTAISTNATNISSLDAQIGSDKIDSYPKDFTPLTSASGANKVYINNAPLTAAGRLTSVRVKTVVGSTVTVYAYSVTTTPSLSFTLLKTYATFVTTSETHTQAIADTFTIQPGQFIGIKSTGNLNYAFVGGAWDVTAGTALATITLSYDFKVNARLNAALTGRVTTLESTVGGFSSAITANTTGVTTLDAQVGGEKLQSYPKDFTPLTLTGGANTVYINKVPLTTSGKLSSIRIKTTVGSTVTVYAYSVVTTPSLTFTLQHTYATFVTTSTTHTQTILDTFTVQAGQYIAVKSTSNISYALVGGGVWSVTGGSSVSVMTMAYDFLINERLNAALTGRVRTLEVTQAVSVSDVADLKAGKHPAQVQLKTAILYRNTMQSLSEFNQTGWSISGGAAVPSDTGSSKKLWLQKRYHINPRKMTLEVTLLSNSVFYIDCLPIDYVQGNGAFVIDAVQNKLIVLDQTGAQVASGTISYSLVSGRRYTVSLSIDNYVSVFDITDTVTGTNYSLTYAVNNSFIVNENRQNDSYAFYLKSGTVSGVKVHSVTISTLYNPMILLIGDSITEGGYFGTSTLSGRYGLLLKSKLRGDLLISARGGAILNDVANKVITEIPFVKPRYVMLTIGTNATGFTESALTTVVNDIAALGCTVIINHVPNRGDASHIAKNVIIDNVCTATGAIRGALFDVSTSIGGDPTAGYITADYFDTGVHPNVNGQLKMYNRILADLPFLFIP